MIEYRISDEFKHLRGVANAMRPGEPFGMTIAEYVRFRRMLLQDGYRAKPPMFVGHRIVLIPSGWTS